MSKLWTQFDDADDSFLRELGTPLDALRSRHRDCPTAQLLAAHSSPELPEPLKEQLDRHLAVCPACRLLAGDLTDAEVSDLRPHEEAAILNRLMGHHAQRSPLSRWTWRLVPVAAAALIILAVLSISHRRTTQPGATAVEPQRQVAMVLPLGKPPLRLPAQAFVIWRGTGNSRRAEYLALSRALEPLTREDYQEMARRLTAFTSQYSHSGEGHFYLGVAQLHLTQNDQALTNLQNAAAENPRALADDIIWFRAVAEERTGQVQQAVADLSSLCSRKMGYAEPSCKAIEQLKSK